MMNRKDFFPFYDWNIYSYTPREGPIFAVKVLEMDGAPPNLPENHSAIEHHDFFHLDHPYMLGAQIHGMGEGIIAKNEHQVFILRKEVETTLFSRNTSAVYEVLYIHTNRREFIRNKNWQSLRSIGKFEFRNSNSR